MKLFFFDCINMWKNSVWKDNILFCCSFGEFKEEKFEYVEKKYFEKWLNKKSSFFDLIWFDNKNSNPIKNIFECCKDSQVIVWYNIKYWIDALRKEINIHKSKDFNIDNITAVDLKTIAWNITNNIWKNIESINDLYKYLFHKTDNDITNLKKIINCFSKLYKKDLIQIKWISKDKTLKNNTNKSIYDSLLIKWNNNPEAIRFIKTVIEWKKSIFLTGKAWSWKSTLINDIISIAFNNKKIPIILWSTWISALNIWWQTVHSFFWLWTHDIYYKDLLKYVRNNKQKNRFSLSENKIKQIIDAPFIIIDEVSMLSSSTLDCINALISHELYNKENPNYSSFAWKQIIFVWDVYQLPPVDDDDRLKNLWKYYESVRFFDSETFKNKINDSILFKDNNFNFTAIELQKNYRQRDDRLFWEILDRIRSQLISDDDVKILNKCVDNVLDEDTIIISTHNNRVDFENKMRLDMLPGDKVSFKSQLKWNFPKDKIIVKEKIELKLWAKVILLNNDSKWRWVNWSIWTITDFIYNQDKSDIKFIKVNINWKDYLVERYTWNNTEFEIDWNKIIERILWTFTQFPIQLAYAITVHKSQWLTFEKCQLDIANIFSWWQAYTALSRVKSLKWLKLIWRIEKQFLYFDEKIFDFIRHIRELNLIYEEADWKNSRRRHSDEDIVSYITDWDLDDIDKRIILENVKNKKNPKLLYRLKLVGDNCMIYDLLNKYFKKIIIKSLDSGFIDEEDIMYACDRISYSYEEDWYLDLQFSLLNTLLDILNIKIKTLYSRIKKNMEYVKIESARSKKLWNISLYNDDCLYKYTKLTENDVYDDILRLYYLRVSYIPLLDENEELETAKKCNNWDESARIKLINSFQWLVIWIAKRFFWKTTLKYIDLIQAWNLWLYTATLKYDPNKKFKFSTYATARIQHEIVCTIADYMYFCKLPNHVFTELFQYKKKFSKLCEKLWRQPTNKELSKYLKIKEKKIKTYKYILWSISYEMLDDTFFINDSLIESQNFWDLDDVRFYDDEIQFIEDDFRKQNLLFTLNEFLSDREFEIITLRYWINADEPLTLENLWLYLNLSRERIRQQEERILGKLKSEYLSNKLNEILILKSNKQKKTGDELKSSKNINVKDFDDESYEFDNDDNENSINKDEDNIFKDDKTSQLLLNIFKE